MVRASAWMSPGSQDANAANVGAGSIVRIGSGELELRFFYSHLTKNRNPLWREEKLPACSFYFPLFYIGYMEGRVVRNSPQGRYKPLKRRTSAPQR